MSESRSQKEFERSIIDLPEIRKKRKTRFQHSSSAFCTKYAAVFKKQTWVGSPTWAKFCQLIASLSLALRLI